MRSDDRAGSRADIDRLLRVERLDRDPGTQGRRRHGYRDPAVQVIALAREDVVRPFVDLHIQVAGRAAAGTDLALLSESDPHAVLHPGRDLHREVAPGPGPPVTAALAAGVRDQSPVPLAGRARAGRDDLAEERALHRLDLPAAATRVAGCRMRARSGALAVARLAGHCGVDADRGLHTERGLMQVELESQDRVGAGARPGAGATRTRVAEERVHDVLEADERASSRRPRGRQHPATAGHRRGRRSPVCAGRRAPRRRR